MELLELVDHEPTARPFPCDWDLCEKSFNRKCDLQRHYRSHTNERPYSCSFPGCGKCFIQRSALTVHIRTHTGERPHQCQHVGCGERFSDSSSLARHRRTHTGKRPYTCAHDGCNKSFCRKNTMIKHQRRSHQRGLHPNQIRDDCTSDSDMGEAPPTFTQSVTSWLAYPDISGHLVPQSDNMAPLLDCNQQMHQYNMQNVGDSAAQQHPICLQRSQSSQHPFYVVEQGMHAVATTNTNMQPTLQVSYDQDELVYTTQSMTTPVTSNTGLFPVAGHSPTISDGMFLHGSRNNFYNRHAIDQQCMIQYTQQMSLQTQRSTGHYPSAHAESEQWYQYQTPVDVAAVGQLSTYGSSLYDFYVGPKIEFDGLS